MPGPSRPPAQSMASAHPSQLLERARALRDALRALFRARHQDLAEIAHTFAAIKREGLHRYLGYANVYAYAWSEHRFGRSKVSELIGISEESATLPKTREAFDAGELPWTKAREITKVATAETEDVWLEKAVVKTAATKEICDPPPSMTAVRPLRAWRSLSRGWVRLRAAGPLLGVQPGREGIAGGAALAQTTQLEAHALRGGATLILARAPSAPASCAPNTVGVIPSRSTSQAHAAAA